MLKELLRNTGSLLQKISDWRDRVLFLFIKPYWPRKVIPNHVTYLRVIVGIILLILLFCFHIENKLLVISLFCVGLITDLLDGSVARGLNKVTEFGAMLDPIADRVLILPIALYTLYKTQPILLMVWFLTEIVNASVSMFYKSKKPYTESNIFGKTKMTLWCLVFVVILVIWPKPLPIFFIDVVWISLIASILSIFMKAMELKNCGYIKSKILTTELNKHNKNYYENI